MASNHRWLMKKCEPLDWDSCGSVLTAVVPRPRLYKSERSGTYSASRGGGCKIRLSDCTRHIEWDFGGEYGDGVNLGKARAFARFANEFLVAIEAAQLIYEKVKKKAKARNEAMGKKEDDEGDTPSTFKMAFSSPLRTELNKATGLVPPSLMTISGKASQILNNIRAEITPPPVYISTKNAYDAAIQGSNLNVNW